MYQNGTLPRIVWPLHFCEVVTTTVERKESEWVSEDMGQSSTIIYINWTLQQLNPMPDISFYCGGRIHCSEMPVMTLKDPTDGRIARTEFKQEQEESGQQKHQWTKQRVCCTYEESLESQALGTKARECLIFSTSKKHQQLAQREALWFRLK